MKISNSRSVTIEFDNSERRLLNKIINDYSDDKCKEFAMKHGFDKKFVVKFTNDLWRATG